MSDVLTGQGQRLSWEENMRTVDLNPTGPSPHSHRGSSTDCGSVVMVDVLLTLQTNPNQ